ncbi:acyltransferase [Paenibacillus sp. P25]|nr:acyltransferase [Paenibacillus sp. P25]
MDSLRGIAALAVLFQHLVLIFPLMETNTYNNSDMWLINLLKYTPIHIIWGGHEAVVFFFVLSGFVLSLVWYSETIQRVSYVSFIIKRTCRIYIPYLVAILVAFIARELFAKGGISELSGWFNSIWAEPITLKMIFDHLLLLGRLQINALNPPIWSLSEEMKISLIFPLFMFILLRFDWKISLALGFLISCLSFRRGYYIPSGTLNYILMFIVGALLAKYRHKLTNSVRNLSSIQKILLSLIGIICYVYSWWPFFDVKLIHSTIVDEWFIALGVSIFITLSLSLKSVSKFLHLKPIMFLGMISYSVYLYHLVILVSLCYLFYGKIHIYIIFLMTILITLVVASLSYYFIEKPSIRLGKVLTSKVKSPMRTSGKETPLKVK